jgi:hypothetical protein
LSKFKLKFVTLLLSRLHVNGSGWHGQLIALSSCIAVKQRAWLLNFLDGVIQLFAKSKLAKFNSTTSLADGGNNVNSTACFNFTR